MFKKDKMVKIDDINIIQRNGSQYKKVSYWMDGTRYSTIVDNDVKLPEIGGTIKRSALRWGGIQKEEMLQQHSFFAGRGR